MKVLQTNLDPDRLLHSIKAAQHRVLLLDYDGTLAPFRVERDQAVPYEGVREILKAILDGGHTRLVIISGRALRDLEPLLGLDPFPEIWGSHGWERRLADGTYLGPELSEACAQALTAAHDWIKRLNLMDRCEDKPASLAVHWRGLSRQSAQKIRKAVVSGWEPLAQEAGLSMKSFDGGVELVMPGKDKGSAVRTVLEEIDEDAMVAYLGDDFTDEDAFEAIRGRGLGILVRTEFRPTKAVAWLRPPDELLHFLDLWR